MLTEPMFPEWSDLAERASADCDRNARDATDDDRTCRAPLLNASAPPDRLMLIRMRAQRRA